jgi:hypothetical protein
MGQCRVTSIKVLLFVCAALTVRFKFEVGTDRNAFSALVAVTVSRANFVSASSRFTLPSPPHGTSKNTP